MSLLTGGPHLVHIWPEIQTTDDAGDTFRTIAAEPFTLRTRVQNLSATEAADLSLDPNTTKFFKTRRDLPPGAWSRIDYDGREWDVIGEPQRYETGGARGMTAHTHVVMKARGPKEV